MLEFAKTTETARKEIEILTHDMSDLVLKGLTPAIAGIGLLSAGLNTLSKATGTSSVSEIETTSFWETGKRIFWGK